jgi:hypothetical protein
MTAFFLLFFIDKKCGQEEEKQLILKMLFFFIDMRSGIHIKRMPLRICKKLCFIDAHSGILINKDKKNAGIFYAFLLLACK